MANAHAQMIVMKDGERDMEGGKWEIFSYVDKL